MLSVTLPFHPNDLCAVKILYAFDELSKTNCLARLPDAMASPVGDLDETTQVGIVELSTCIQAITMAR